MRIFGGRDYYDSASAYGIDEGIVFTRDSVVVSESDLPIVPQFKYPNLVWKDEVKLPSWKWTKPKHNIAQVPVLFAGKFYCGFSVTFMGKIGSQTVYFWNEEKAQVWAHDNGYELVISKPKWSQDTYNDLFVPVEIADLSNLIDKRIVLAYLENYSDYDFSSRRYNYSHRSNTYRWVINGDELGKLGFQSMFDPVSAFQEIAMWVGGALSATNSPDIVEITDDVVKAEKHGMDKWSFRKLGKNSKID